MKQTFKRFLVLTVSFSFLVTSTAGAAPLAASAPTEVTGPVDLGKEIAAADDYTRQYHELEQVGEGQPKGSLPPDRFLLMEQTAFPKEVPVVKTFVGHVFRKWALQAMIKKVDAYLKALETGTTSPAPFEKTLTVAEIKTAYRSHLIDGRRTDTPLFIWERRADRAQLQQIQEVLTATERNWAYNERQDVANPTEAPLERKVRAINWWDTSVQIQNEDNVVKTLHMKDTSAGINTSGEQPYFCPSSGTCRFNLMKGKEHLNVFGVPAHVIATFDQYVVFAHNDSFDAASGTQYLSFLDLGTYNGLIGNEDIPVFRLPLKINAPIRSLTMQDGQLVLNGEFKLAKSFLDQASDMQQVAFNLQANLISPDSWAKVLPLVDSLQEYVKKAINQEILSAGQETQGTKEVQVLLGKLGQELQADLEAQKKLKPLTQQQEASLQKKIDTAESHGLAVQSLKTYHKLVSESSQLAKIMSQSQKRSRVSRQLTARVRLLGSTLLSPRPFASQKIKEALGIWYVHQADGTGGTTHTSAMERMIQLTDRPYVNAGVLSAALLAVAAPESFHTLVNAGLGVSTGILDYIVFALKGIGESTATGSSATFSSFIDPIHSLGKQYVENGNWWRSLVGIPLFLSFLGSLYFVPHFVFNFAQLYKDLRKPGINGFVDRQNKFKAEYYQRLATDEGERRNFGNDVKFSEQEEAEIQAFISERRTEIANRKFLGLFGHKQADVVKTIDASLENQNEELATALDAADSSTAIAKAAHGSVEEFTNFWAAAKHFAFSMPSLELTLGRWANIWNWWASWRFTTLGWGHVRILGSDIPLYIKFRPVSFVARLIYPDFMKTAVFSRKDRVVLPTELNGGLNKRCTQLYQAACRLMDFNSTPESFSPKQQLQALERFEDQIIGVEDHVVEVAFRKSLEVLAEFMQSKDDLKALFNSTSLDSITQKDIKNLSWSSQTFLRAHFESIYDATMKKFLGEILEDQNSTELQSRSLDVGTVSESNSVVDADQEVTQRTLRALKSEIVHLQAPNGELADYSFDAEKAKAMALTIAEDPQHRVNAEAAVANGRLDSQNYLLNAKFDLASDMDPKQNKSWARVETVHRRLESPAALGRALRAEISKLKLTFPIDLTSKLLLSAGIYEGAMKPIQDSFWGPNSTFYLSQTSFYMMMASGFFMSMMADAWLKLQQDARQDDMGEFGHIPQGEDAEKSFVNWYHKQYSAKENSLMKNWGFSNALSFWNMPAAIANISLFYFMFSGRIDLSLLTAGYALAFGTPLSAYSFKLDQAFERAAHYPARGVKDEKWLAHPAVQELLVPEMQRYRNNFTIFKDIYANVQGNWTGNIEMIPTSLGPRGFQRALFGGGLLEEYIVNYALTPARTIVHGVPVLDQVVTPVANLCQTLLTHGNVDIRLKK